MKNRYCFVKKIAVRIILPAIIGVITFLIVYGIIPLDVTNDKWIAAGYDEFDIVQHYSGWLAYRTSDWAYPLGLAENMGYGEGTYISYTDSIPWVAVFFKIFREWLPATFQYFGIYTLLSFMLQGGAAFNIIYKESKSILYSAIGTLLFTFAPILLERSFRHTSLGSQWLVLFAILLYLYHRENQKRIHYAGYLLLLVLAIGIHPYFLPMVAVFMVLCAGEDVINKRYNSIILIGINLIFTYMAGCVLGVLGTGIEGVAEGYGFFSMNLNALVNPSSIGYNRWSRVIPVQSQTLGNYDGFNYLGFGVICGIVLLLLHVIKTQKISNIIALLKKEWLLVAAMLFCTIFAISNVVTWNDSILFEIPLPDTIERLCGIFRASSRIFYPVYYCIFIGLLTYLWRCGKHNKKIVLGITSMIVLIQLFDMSGCFAEKHRGMIAHAEYESMITDPGLTEIAKRAEYLILDDYGDDNYRIGLWGAKHNLKLYFTTGNRGDYKILEECRREALEKIQATGNIEKYVIVTDNEYTAQLYDGAEDFAVYHYGGKYFIYDESPFR